MHLASLLSCWPFVQNLNGVLTFPALVGPGPRQAGSGNGHVGRLGRHVYVVLAICSEPKGRFNFGCYYEAKEEIRGFR